MRFIPRLLEPELSRAARHFSATTALRFATALPGLLVLSFDARILANLEPLGLLAAAAEP